MTTSRPQWPAARPPELHARPVGVLSAPSRRLRGGDPEVCIVIRVAAPKMRDHEGRDLSDHVVNTHDDLRMAPQFSRGHHPENSILTGESGFDAGDGNRFVAAEYLDVLIGDAGHREQ